MGGCGGSCGCGGKAELWTRGRLSAAWDAVRDAVSADRSPLELLRAVFSKDVDVSELGDDGADSMARLWLAWGVLEGMAALQTEEPERSERMTQARTLLAGALGCGAGAGTVAEIRYNLGVSLLALAAEHQDAPEAAVPWEEAARELAAVVDGDSGDRALHVAARRGLGLAYSLVGIAGRALRVRKRQLALDNALAVLEEGDPLRELATSASCRLSSLGAATRLLGRHGERLAESDQLLSPDAFPAFVLPSELQAVFAQRQQLDRRVS